MASVEAAEEVATLSPSLHSTQLQTRRPDHYQAVASSNGICLFHHGDSVKERCTGHEQPFRFDPFFDVQLYQTYSDLEFRKKVISLFQTPELTKMHIKDLMSV